MTANDLADEILKDRKRQKSTEKQVGSLPKVIAILIEKSDTLYTKIQKVVINLRGIKNGNDTLIWKHSTYGKWKTYKWGPRGYAFDAWTTDYDSGDL